MKKIYEGASVVSAILLLLTAASAFIFNVKTHTDKRKVQRKEERKAEKRMEEQRRRHKDNLSPIQAELEYYKKLDDPFWHYYDHEGEVQVKPGKYGVDDPGGRQ